MKNALIILGNGFDLAHGLKTSYSDFIKFIKKQPNINNLWIKHFEKLDEDGNWVDFEREFHEVTTLFSQFRNSYPSLNISDVVELKFEKLLKFLHPNWISKAFMKSNAPHNTRTAYVVPNYQKSDESWDYDKIYEVLRDDFLELKNELRCYLKNHSRVNPEKKIRSIEECLKRYEKIEVINFNYNDNIKIYHEKCHNINIHGSIDEEIVLGHNEISSSEFAVFNKNSQCISEMLHGYQIEISTADDFDLIILGHSLSENDFEAILFHLEKSLNSSEEGKVNITGIDEVIIFTHDYFQKMSTIHNFNKLMESLSQNCVIIEEPSKGYLYDLKNKDKIKFINYK